MSKRPINCTLPHALPLFPLVWLKFCILALQLGFGLLGRAIIFEEFGPVSIKKALNSRVSTGGLFLGGHFGNRRDAVLSPSELEFCFWCMDNTPRICRCSFES